jgi:hypothetical protein
MLFSFRRRDKWSARLIEGIRIETKVKLLSDTSIETGAVLRFLVLARCFSGTPLCVFCWQAASLKKTKSGGGTQDERRRAREKNHGG